MRFDPAAWSRWRQRTRVFKLPTRARKAAYWCLFTTESAGMLFTLWIVLPLYRKLVAGPGGYRPGAPLILPIFLIATVMQLSYWASRRIRPPVRRGQNTVAGHFLLFLSRLSFIFAGANLSLILFRRTADTTVSPLGVAVLFYSSFAQFCYVRELEALARIVEGGSTGEQARTDAG